MTMELKRSGENIKLDLISLFLFIVDVYCKIFESIFASDFLFGVHLSAELWVM